jgi:hypothetical protein
MVRDGDLGIEVIVLRRSDDNTLTCIGSDLTMNSDGDLPRGGEAGQAAARQIASATIRLPRGVLSLAVLAAKQHDESGARPVRLEQPKAWKTNPWVRDTVALIFGPDDTLRLPDKHGEMVVTYSTELGLCWTRGNATQRGG